MDQAVGQLVDAFRGELEACHAYLDTAGVPRKVGQRFLSLKDRIIVLVEADEESAKEASALHRELHELKAKKPKRPGR